MTFQMEPAEQLLHKWQKLLRLRDWDIRIQFVTQTWRKTGDIKIDLDNRNAVLLLNERNPRGENLEHIVIHELLHLKLYPMDQMLEQLLVGVFGEDESDPKYSFAHTQFMVLLESTVEDLSRGYLDLGGTETRVSFGRVQEQVDDELRS